MKCEQAGPLLARVADGTFAPDRDLAEHLRACSACREALDEQRATRGALSSRLDATVPLGFAARVMADLETAPGWLGALNWRVWTLRLAPVAGALLVAAALGVGPTGRSESAGPVDFSELVAAWVTDDANAGRLETMTLLWQDEVSDEVLLDVLLTEGPN